MIPGEIKVKKRGKQGKCQSLARSKSHGQKRMGVVVSSANRAAAPSYVLNPSGRQRVHHRQNSKTGKKQTKTEQLNAWVFVDGEMALS